MSLFGFRLDFLAQVLALPKVVTIVEIERRTVTIDFDVFVGRLFQHRMGPKVVGHVEESERGEKLLSFLLGITSKYERVITHRIQYTNLKLTLNISITVKLLLTSKSVRFVLIASGNGATKSYIFDQS